MDMDKRIVVRTPLTPGRLVHAYIDAYLFKQQQHTGAQFEYIEEPVREITPEEIVDAGAQPLSEFSIGDVSPHMELLPLLEVLKETQGSDTTFIDSVRAVISQNTPEDAVTKLFPVFDDLVTAMQEQSPTEEREEDKFQKPIERSALETIGTVAKVQEKNTAEETIEETVQVTATEPETEQEPESVQVKISKIITDESALAEKPAEKSVEKPIEKVATEQQPEKEMAKETVKEEPGSGDNTLQELLDSGAAQAYEVEHYDDPSLTMVVLDGNHSDTDEPTSNNTHDLTTHIFADTTLEPGVVLHTVDGMHALRANPNMKVELRDVVRVVRVEEARKRGVDVRGESSRALSKPGELDELPGWYFDHEANTLTWRGDGSSKLSSAEMTQAVYAGLNNELLEANCPPQGCRGPECYFFMYQLPRCKARKKESGWKADGSKRN